MPDTGGSNIPALNDLLEDFGIALGDAVSEGYFTMGDHSMYYASGSSIIRFPNTNGSIIIERELHDQGLEVLTYINFQNRFIKNLNLIYSSFVAVIKEKRNVPFPYWECYKRIRQC